MRFRLSMFTLSLIFLRTKITPAGESSELLSEAINSIIDAKEENDIDSLFKSGGTSALLSAVSGLDDFELICFLVVK